MAAGLCSLLHHMLLLLVLVLQAFSQLLALSHSSLVEFLPGIQGSLPFQLETGYVGVGESEEAQLFYYFVKSERNPGEDPLLLWLPGGRACSALTTFFEIGPLNIKIEQYNGSLPTLILNPHSWTKVSSIIFIDSPVGSGFSYAATSFASQLGDLEVVQHALQFLRKWLVDHPEFMLNPVYIGGVSYSGLLVPILFQQISNGNEAGIKPMINIQCTSEINRHHILERSCSGLDPPKPKEMQPSKRRYLNDNYNVFLPSESPLPTLGCRSYGYLLSQYWANDPYVRKALHIRKGSIGKWQRCNYDMPYNREIFSSFQYHVKLSAKGHYRFLIYSGDHDMLVPFLSTQAWIRSLNYSIIDDWRPWILQGQIAGYTRTYSNKMTYATVKGAGHSAPRYKPEECLNMFTRWIFRGLL